MTLILSGTDGLSDVDGSAATPAIRGTDANTGIFFGTDIIGFSEGGVEAMRINASGNVEMAGTLTTSAAGIAKASLPTGSVLQVVSKQITTETSTSSASFVDLTDFSQAITPSSASSKILVFFSVQSVVNNLNNNSPVRLLRDSTGLQDYDYWNYNGAGAIMVVGSYSYLDSPNTTSSVTYKLQGRSLNGGIGQVVNFIYDDVNGDAKGSITLMEIAA